MLLNFSYITGILHKKLVFVPDKNITTLISMLLSYPSVWPFSLFFFSLQNCQILLQFVYATGMLYFSIHLQA
jgi:hypothetical protein